MSCPPIPTSFPQTAIRFGKVHDWASGKVWDEVGGGGGGWCMSGRCPQVKAGGQKSITSRRRKAWVQKLPDNSEFCRLSTSSNLVTCTASGTCQNIVLVSVMWGYAASATARSVKGKFCNHDARKRGAPINWVHAVMTDNQPLSLYTLGCNLHLTGGGSVPVLHLDVHRCVQPCASLNNEAIICPRRCQQDLMFLPCSEEPTGSSS